MMTHIIDGTQLQTAVTVSTIPADPGVKPEQARQDAGKPEPVREAAARESDSGAEREATDRGLRAADRLLADLADSSVGVTFVKVDGIDDPVIRVVNRETGEVVRQIPPDEVLELKKRFAELLGMFKDLKA